MHTQTETLKRLSQDLVNELPDLNLAAQKARLDLSTTDLLVDFCDKNRMQADSGDYSFVMDYLVASLISLVEKKKDKNVLIAEVFNASYSHYRKEAIVQSEPFLSQKIRALEEAVENPNFENPRAIFLSALDLWLYLDQASIETKAFKEAFVSSVARIIAFIASQEVSSLAPR